MSARTSSSRPDFNAPMSRTMSRSVSSSIERPMSPSSPLVAVRAQHVARDQEPLLDLLVSSLEAAILVLDDAVALVAGAIQLAVDHAPVDVPEAGDPRDLPAHAHRHDPALVETVPVD